MKPAHTVLVFLQITTALPCHRGPPPSLPNVNDPAVPLQSHCFMPTCVHLPFTKSFSGPGSDVSFLSLAVMTSMFPLGIRSIIHCAGTTPVSLVNLPDNRRPEKNESITTVVPGDGFHVHEQGAGKNPSKPLKVTFTAKASLAVVLSNTHRPL